MKRMTKMERLNEVVALAVDEVLDAQDSILDASQRLRAAREALVRAFDTRRSYQRAMKLPSKGGK